MTTIRQHLREPDHGYSFPRPTLADLWEVHARDHRALRERGREWHVHLESRSTEWEPADGHGRVI